MKKEITCIKGKLDINGNRLYIYNFIDENGNNWNAEFKGIGRQTKKGVSSQYEPIHMQEYLQRFGTWLNLPVGIQLGKFQKQIDRCNNKSGCNSCCGSSRRENCTLLKNHSKEMEKLSIVQDFLKLDINIIE